MTDVAQGPATIRLKPGEEARVLGGHLWLFSNELQDVPKLSPGELAVAVSSRNEPLGVGFYHPHSLIAWRLVSRKVEEIDAAFFQRRLAAALRLRERCYPGARSYRLCFGESDQLPGLVVDRFEDVLVLQVLSAGIEARLPAVVEALTALLSPRAIYLNAEHPARALEQLPRESRVLAGQVPPRVTIEENGCKFEVAISQGQKTGYYFDQRENRSIVAAHASGRSVLDLYCYTGSFAVQAAKGGATHVLGLDSAGPAIALARENAALNGVQERCEFDEGDAEEVLEAFAARKQPFAPDFILLDPPSFAPSKKHVHKALRALIKLNALAMKVLEPGGLLATSTCSHHISRQDFLEVLREAAAKARKTLRINELRGQAKDHPVLLGMPETEYLHFALLEVV